MPSERACAARKRGGRAGRRACGRAHAGETCRPFAPAHLSHTLTVGPSLCPRLLPRLRVMVWVRVCQGGKKRVVGRRERATICVDTIRKKRPHTPSLLRAPLPLSTHTPCTHAPCTTRKPWAPAAPAPPWPTRQRRRPRGRRPRSRRCRGRPPLRWPRPTWRRMLTRANARRELGWMVVGRGGRGGIEQHTHRARIGGGRSLGAMHHLSCFFTPPRVF